MLLKIMEISWLKYKSDTIIWMNWSGPFNTLDQIGKLIVGVIFILKNRAYSTFQLSNFCQ